MPKTSFVYVTADEDKNLTVRVTKDMSVALSFDQDEARRPLRLVYFEQFGSVRDADKRWRKIARMSKVSLKRLIDQSNPSWQGLVAGTEWVTPFGDILGRLMGDFGDDLDAGGGVLARNPRRPEGPRIGAAALEMPSPGEE